MNPEFPSSDDDRYLVIDDTEEDLIQILTVICDRGFRPACLDADHVGGAP